MLLALWKTPQGMMCSQKSCTMGASQLPSPILCVFLSLLKSFGYCLYYGKCLYLWHLWTVFGRSWPLSNTLKSSYHLIKSPRLHICSTALDIQGVFSSLFLVLSKASQYTPIFQKSLKAWGSSGLPGLQQSLKVLLKVARQPCHSKKTIMGLLDL